MGTVGITRTDKGIKQGLMNVLDIIGGIGRYISHTDTVMLKPNINGTEGLTSIELVEELILLLIDFGVKKIVIAESTFGSPEMTDVFFKKSGYGDLADKFGIELINLNKSDISEITVDKPLALGSLKIAKDVLDVDKIINLPVMKVHYATGITLSMKNLKGLLVRNEKRHFHEIGLDKAIVDLNRTIKPALNIIDCISCMERMGPRGGDTVKLNVLIAGADCAEVDYVGSTIMGYDPDEVKHLKYYIAEESVDINTIDIVGENIDDVRYNFKKVNMARLIPQEFIIHDSDACSSCMNALLLSCQFLEKDNIRDAEIYLGSNYTEPKEDKKIRIAFGNCSNKSMAAVDHRVRGCPPFPLLLNETLKMIDPDLHCGDDGNND